MQRRIDRHSDVHLCEAQETARDAAITMKPAQFVVTAGAMLVAIGVAKLWSAFGTAEVLKTIDPVFDVPFRLLFLFVGIIELVVGAVCVFARNLSMRAALLLWIATSFILYRIGLHWLGYKRPCPCLGSFTDALGINAARVDSALKVLIAIIIIGSAAILIRDYFAQRGRRA